MQTFIVREYKYGILLPLFDLIERLPKENIESWHFRQITMSHGCPFGMSVVEFEAATRATQSGYEVLDEEFQAFLKSDFQIIDGEVEAWSGPIQSKCIWHITCEDATQWEITTDSLELIRKLENAGFQRA